MVKAAMTISFFPGRYFIRGGAIKSSDYAHVVMIILRSICHESYSIFRS